MKKVLRYILDFLDRKWPDQVVVTLATFKMMDREMRQIELDLKSHDKSIIEIAVESQATQDRLKKLEDDLGKLNVALGFMGARQPFQR